MTFDIDAAARAITCVALVYNVITCMRMTVLHKKYRERAQRASFVADELEKALQKIERRADSKQADSTDPKPGPVKAIASITEQRPTRLEEQG